MTVAIDDDSYAAGNRDSANAGDKCMHVSSYCTDADFVRLAALNTRVTNIDIITPLGQFESRIASQGDVR